LTSTAIPLELHCKDMFQPAAVFEATGADTIVLQCNNDKIHRYDFRVKRSPPAKIKHLDIVPIHKRWTTYTDKTFEVKYKLLTTYKEHSCQSKGHS